MDSKQYEKVILPEAESDIIEILDYIHDELKNPTAAKKLYQNILEAIDRASLFPYAMPKLKNEVITAGKEYIRWRPIYIRMHCLLKKARFLAGVSLSLFCLIHTIEWITQSTNCLIQGKMNYSIKL